MAINEGDIVNSIIGGLPQEVFTKTSDDPVLSTTKAFIELLIKELGDTLDKEGISATGGLKASINPSKIKVTSKGISIEVSADSYAKFVDEGVTGFVTKTIRSDFSFKSLKVAPSMAEAIREWIPAKGLFARSGQSYESMSYAIATGIKMHGVEPTNFIEETFNSDTIKAFQKALSEVVGGSIAFQFKEYGNNN